MNLPEGECWGGPGQKPQSSRLHPDHRARPGERVCAVRMTRLESRKEGFSGSASRSPPGAASSLPAAGPSLTPTWFHCRGPKVWRASPHLWKQSVFPPEKVSIPFLRVAGTCAVSPPSMRSFPAVDPMPTSTHACCLQTGHPRPLLCLCWSLCLSMSFLPVSVFPSPVCAGPGARAGGRVFELRPPLIRQIPEARAPGEGWNASART